MMKRDLKADLELCNRATMEPWSTIDHLGKYVTTTGEAKSFTREQFIQSEQETICTTYKPKNKHNAKFIAEAREGWPHAIERAIEAEALNRELAEALEKAIEELNHPICGPGSVVGDLEEVLAKYKEVLEDE